MRAKIGMTIILTLASIFGFSFNANADMSRFLSLFHPYLDLQEQYTDNVYLSDTDTKSDYITTIAPGLRISTIPEPPVIQAQVQPPPQISDRSGIILNYRPGFVFFANNSELNNVSHLGTLDTWYATDQHITLRLREYFNSSDEMRERDYMAGARADQFLLSSQRERAQYWRNVIEPQIEYQFGSENLVALLYRNNIYRNENPIYENSQENFISPRLNYWLDIRNGITLEYGFTRGEFERTSDFVMHSARGRYTHRVTPQTSLFFEYIYLNQNSDESAVEDYDIHNPSVGMEHAFSPSVVGVAQFGYFWQIPERTSTTEGLSVLLSLSKRTERTLYDFIFSGGYSRTYFQAENTGFSRYYRFMGSVTHLFTENFSVSISCAVERNEGLAEDRDWTYIGRAGISYQMLTWLGAFFDIYRRERNSNISGLDYIENSAIVRLRASL